MLKEHIAMVGAWVYSIDLLYSLYNSAANGSRVFFALPLLDNTISWKIYESSFY